MSGRRHDAVTGRHLVARVLGAPTFRYRSRAVEIAPLKARALLAFLAAVDRGVPRRELAELLWGPGRLGSVHQALHTIRACPGGRGWLSRGRGPVALTARTDTRAFERSVQRGRDGRALRIWRGVPFSGLHVPGAPAFEDWLQLERMRLEEVRRGALRREAERLERAGATAQALALTRALLDHDAIDEIAHRTTIRLHLGLGDLRAAREAFETCRRSLLDELDAEPLAETLELGDAIGAAERAIVSASPDRALAAVPPALLRPPLVGRGAALERVEAAWRAGLIAVVLAPGGMGKTRLALDAADRRPARGRVRLEGRPGDDAVAYTSLARAMRRLLDAVPGVRLPPWAWRELDRVAPGAAARAARAGSLEGATVPRPERPRADEADDAHVSVPVDAIRLRQAFAALYEAVQDRLGVVIVDDLHFFDADSRAIVIAAIAERGPRRAVVLVAAREAELAPPAYDSLRALVEVGRATDVTIPPLDVAAIASLLRPLGVGSGPRLASDLERYTGGNPLFVMETLRALHRDGALRDDDASPAGLAAPARVTGVLERRLERLDVRSLRVARVLALEPGAAIDLVVDVLDLGEHDVAEALARLDSAELTDVHGAMTHDVVVDVVRAHAPASVRRVLHRRLAEALSARGAAPGRVALHDAEGDRLLGLDQRHL